ncbi:MAG: hypothetical protein DRH37_08880 [Deltaproteobacteria bacterium]|nr:MAG: hypothetical protein DRH37_08880 [Deltaproteobacteria bacterium]
MSEIKAYGKNNRPGEMEAQRDFTGQAGIWLIFRRLFKDWAKGPFMDGNWVAVKRYPFRNRSGL